MDKVMAWQNNTGKIRLFGVILILIAGSTGFVFSQSSIRRTAYRLELAGSSSSDDKSAFWLQNNQNGTVAFQPNSVGFSAALFKAADTNTRIFDYGFKVDSRLQIADNLRIFFPEIYLNARLKMFELKVGRSIELFGNQDSILSAGGLLFSQNALPIPSVSAGMPQFTTVPYTFNLLEIKGAIIHGYFTDNIAAKNMLLHHKFGYVRAGGRFPVNIQYGLHHVAQWGGFVPELGQQPVGLDNFLKIFLVKSGGDDALVTDQINRLGNHIISQNLKVELDLPVFQVDAYWQNIAEDGPVRFITKTMNVNDGLWGLALKSDRFPAVKRILYEYLNTTDQSGPYHDKDGIVYGGGDSYFLNGVYQTGWTYFSRTIGTPFITSPAYSGTFQTKNNRVQVHHFGINGEIKAVNYKMLLSFSKNYGTYGQPISPMKNGNMFLLEMSRKFPSLSNVEAAVSLAADRGSMYGNNTGFMIRLVKTGNFLK